MDDRNFDEIIKGKLEAYEDPDFDSSALAEFHERLSLVQYTPWYIQYRTEGLIGGLVLFTLLNSFIVLYGINRKESSTAELKHDFKKRIDSLTVILDQLKDKQQASVFVLNSSDKKSPQLNAGIDDTENRNQVTRGNNPLLHTNLRLDLGPVASLPAGVFERLSEERVLETEEGEAFLILSDKIKTIRRQTFASNLPDGPQLFPEKEIVLSDDKIKQIRIVSPKTASLSQLSSKMINKIEAHQYRKGIGLNLTGHMDLVGSAFSHGVGGITPRVGITAEWVIAPHWSVETSLDYLNTNLTVHHDFQSLHLVDPSPELGSLQGVEINTRTLSMPVTLKYRRWLNRQHQLVLRGGYTPYFSLNRQYLYKHPYPGRPADSDRTISTLEHADNVEFYGGTVNIKAGLNTILKKKNQFEVDLFYEQSLKGVGSEKLGLQLYGILAAFTIRVK